MDYSTGNPLWYIFTVQIYLVFMFIVVIVCLIWLHRLTVWYCLCVCFCSLQCVLIMITCLLTYLLTYLLTNSVGKPVAECKNVSNFSAARDDWDGGNGSLDLETYMANLQSYCQQQHTNHHLLPARRYASAVFAVDRCLSVCPLHAGIASK